MRQDVGYVSPIESGLHGALCHLSQSNELDYYTNESAQHLGPLAIRRAS